MSERWLSNDNPCWVSKGAQLSADDEVVCTVKPAADILDECADVKHTAHQIPTIQALDTSPVDAESATKVCGCRRANIYASQSNSYAKSSASESIHHINGQLLMYSSHCVFASEQPPTNVDSVTVPIVEISAIAVFLVQHTGRCLF